VVAASSRPRRSAWLAIGLVRAPPFAVPIEPIPGQGQRLHLIGSKRRGALRITGRPSGRPSLLRYDRSGVEPPGRGGD
jgi:hypothetical protein